MPPGFCYPRAVKSFFLSADLDNRGFNRLVMVMIGAGFLALMIAGIATAVLMQRNQDQSRWVRHTYEVERHVSSVQLALARLRTPGIDQKTVRQRLETEVAEVRRLTFDNPVQQRNISTLASRFAEVTHLYEARKIDAAEANRAGASLEALALTMLRNERALLDTRRAAQRAGAQRVYTVLIFAGVLLLMVGAASILVIRRYTNSLSTAHAQLQKLNMGLEDAVAERTVDLQRANEEIQRFAYIVSHDLRSPLVNVMGFTAELETALTPLRKLLSDVEAEAPALANADARLAITEDLPESIGFIRSSTQKMDRLINAILRLSREGRRTITSERIDLNDLAHGVVDSLRHRIDTEGVDVQVVGDLPTITSDRLAVEQIIGNLVENAVKYLKPGRPGMIQISGQTRHGRAMIDVEDNGRGIEARDHQRVFDLFRRSGEQDQPGEGIGLAHVRALAYRLGGVILLKSELGVGSVFTVNLPIEFAGEKGVAQ